MHRLRTLTVAAVVPGLLVLSACGSSTESAPTSGAPKTASAASSASSPAPAQVAQLSDGTLNVFADGTYVPYEFLDKDGKTMTGFEPEMLAAIGEKLGVKVEYQNMQFDGMIPGIANGRADLMIMGMADTEKRRKTVDFLDLYRSQYRIVTREGNPSNISLGDNPGANGDTLRLCGLKVAVTTGGQQEQTAKFLDDQCKKAGKPGITSQAFLQPTQEYLAVKNGRVDFNIMVPANADYFVKNNPGYQVVDGSFPNPSGQYTGWILSKDATALQTELLRVINELIADGTWTKILAKWGISEADAVLPPLRNTQPAS